MESLLAAENICLQFNDKIVLDKVSFELSSGQITTIIGPNGSGKTSLIRVLLGLQKPSSGTVRRNKDASIGYMPQKIQIDSTLPLSVRGFLALAERKLDRCQNALRQVGVSHLLNSPMAYLSGGETQRILLARALLRNPRLLVLDEPVQGVDVNGQEELYKLISDIRDQTGCGILMISHDLHLVMASTDEVLCLNHHLCCHGPPEVVSSDPIYRELFGSKTALYTHDHDHRHDLHGEVSEKSHGACQHD